MKHKGRKNVYNCKECHNSIVTIDLHKGDTPSVLKCKATESCRGWMQSMFYLVDQDLEAEFEWYKPKGEEYKKLSPFHQSQVRYGKLLLRRKK